MGFLDWIRQVGTSIVGGIQTGFNWLNKNIRDPVLGVIKKVPIIGGLVGSVIDPITNFTDKGINQLANSLQNKPTYGPDRVTWDDVGGAALGTAQLGLMMINPAAGFVGKGAALAKSAVLAKTAAMPTLRAAGGAIRTGAQQLYTKAGLAAGRIMVPKGASSTTLWSSTPMNVNKALPSLPINKALPPLPRGVRADSMASLST